LVRRQKARWEDRLSGSQLRGTWVVGLVRRHHIVDCSFASSSVQFHLRRNGSGRIELMDVESALGEMLFRGGPFILKLLAAEGA
jgi:hypothetical protein